MSSAERKRAVIYARLSTSKDESVSLQRQVESARAYAAAQGWAVVGAPWTDDGVSATSHSPGERAGWKGLLQSPETFDVVLVWKIDRLARRALDFLQVDALLALRGAGIVSVTEPIDMTSAQGRAFATMLAVFAEMEGDAIRSRVKAARDYLIKDGRAVGGNLPYGWMTVKNPNGNGKVVVQDPDRVTAVRRMAQMALEGQSINAITTWCNQPGNVPARRATKGTPAPTGRWGYTSVSRLLHNPLLAGMIRHQPGRGRHDAPDPTAVLRDAHGMPVIEESLAILTPGEYRRLLQVLDNRQTPQARPRASKKITSPLLSGLATCDECDRTMHRGTTQGRPSLSCRNCHQTISRGQLDRHLVDRLLAERGHVRIWKNLEVLQDEDHLLAEVLVAINDVGMRIVRQGADRGSLLEQLDHLHRREDEIRRGLPPVQQWVMTNRTVAEMWQDSQSEEERRGVLQDQLQDLRIRRGRVGRSLDPDRVQVTWRPEPAPDTFRSPTGRTFVPSQQRSGEVLIGAVSLRFPDGTVHYTEPRDLASRIDEDHLA